jgi:hypothetical protein
MVTRAERNQIIMTIRAESAHARLSIPLPVELKRYGKATATAFSSYLLPLEYEFATHSSDWQSLFEGSIPLIIRFVPLR